MAEPAWEYECIGPWTFRVAPCLRSSGWMSEAKRGPFTARNLLYEAGDCYFEFGKTKYEALIKLKAEVLPLTFAKPDIA